MASRMDGALPNQLVDGQELAAPDAQPGSDRRGARRHATVLLVGQVRHRGIDAMCLVHDISPGGVMARFTTIPVVGEDVQISVRGMAAARANIRWVRGYKAGLAFDTPQDLSKVLGKEDGKVARAPRFAVSLATQMTVRGERTVVELVDLSPGGAKLIVDGPLTPGTPVQLSLPTAPAPLPATICWCKDGRMGLRFTFPLSMTMLADTLALGDHETDTLDD